jgi:plasmid stabilization system protein ParE
MTYSLHPGAEQDIAEALDFYTEEAGRVVAARFLDEFERAANLLTEYPGLGAPTTRGRRIFPLKVFPYSLVYRELEGEIRILIVRHQQRRPGYAGRRR